MFAQNRRFSVNGSVVRSTAVSTERRSVVKTSARVQETANLFGGGSMFGGGYVIPNDPDVPYSLYL